MACGCITICRPTPSRLVWPISSAARWSRDTDPILLERQTKSPASRRAFLIPDWLLRLSRRGQSSSHCSRQDLRRWREASHALARLQQRAAGDLEAAVALLLERI